MPDGEREPSTVERIYKLVAEGWTIGQIAEILNKEMPESNEMPRWSTDVVARLRQLAPQVAKCSSPSDPCAEHEQGQEFDERG